MDIRAVFFDLDETLVDASACHHLANTESFARFGLDYKRAKELSLTYDSLGRRMVDNLKVRREALGVGESQLPIRKLAKIREKIFIDCVSEKAALYRGGEKALKQARESGRIVGIVSSGTRKYIRKVLAKFNLSKWVDFTVGEEDVILGKPEPDCYLQAFDKLPPELKIGKMECLVVEDSVNGVMAAKAAGLKVLLVQSQDIKGEIEADWKLNSLEDFDFGRFI